MKTISEYEIRLGTDVHSLAQKIQNDIDDGWQPFGSLQVSGDQVPRLYQAIVKYK